MSPRGGLRWGWASVGITSGAAFGFVGARVSLASDVLRAEVELGGQRVVSSTPEREICWSVFAALRERHEVVEFEAVGLAATLAAVVAVRAARAVPLEDGAANAGRDVTGAPSQGLRWLRRVL